MNLEDVLSNLVESSGVSGFEYSISNAVENTFRSLSDSIKQDIFGNVVAYKRGNNDNPIKIMLAAHIDEIGLMVKDIDKNGFIKFTNIGGIDQRILLSQEVIIHGKKDTYGIIGAKPPHLQTAAERKESVKIEDLFIDVGLTKDDVEKYISIGDSITFDQKSHWLHNKVVSSKALDDRAGIVAILECFKELGKLKHGCDVYGVATVQEEVGTRGAIISTYNVEPDIGIAIDVGFGTTPELSKDDTMELGKGPGIKIGANIHPSIHKRFIEVAKDYNIPFQIGIIPGMSGTDARAIQISKSGVASGLISLPLRYMHTTVETMDINDIRNAGKLLAYFISSLDFEDLEGFLCF